MSSGGLPEPRDDLRETPDIDRIHIAREIEAKAGVGLTREYWTQTIHTPLGLLSRRAILLTILGLLLTCIVFVGAISWRLRDIPEVVILPYGDARTVMIHIHANFSGAKDPQIQPFFAPAGENWFFTDAYTFFWLDASGKRQQVVVLSYPDSSAAETDYYTRIRLLSTVNQNQTVYRSPNMIAELSSLPTRDSQWKGIHLSNLLMLMSPTVSAGDQQQLYSHFITITAAGHREAIPTATPY